MYINRRRNDKSRYKICSIIVLATYSYDCREHDITISDMVYKSISFQVVKTRIKKQLPLVINPGRAKPQKLLVHYSVHPH